MAEHDLTFVHARGGADRPKVAVSNHLGGEQGVVSLLPGTQGASPKKHSAMPTRLALVATPVVANAEPCQNTVGRPRPGSEGILGQKCDGRGLCWEDLRAGATPRGFWGYVRRIWGLGTQWATSEGAWI